MITLIPEGARPIAAPKGWDHNLDGECGHLHVVEAVDLMSGLPVLYSLYKPTEEEVLALAEGGSLRLGILGGGHPVINMAVLGPKLTGECKAAEGFDMGPIIERGVNV